MKGKIQQMCNNWNEDQQNNNEINIISNKFFQLVYQTVQQIKLQKQNPKSK